jgi:septal ring factor EnvC (AmiA/AmiB activator)
MQCPGVVRVEAGNQDRAILTNGLHTVEATPDAVLVDGKDVLKMLQEKQQLIEEQQRQLGATNDALTLANQDLANLRRQLVETQNQLTATNKVMTNLKDEIFLLGAANWIPLKSLKQPTT